MITAVIFTSNIVAGVKNIGGNSPPYNSPGEPATSKGLVYFDKIMKIKCAICNNRIDFLDSGHINAYPHIEFKNRKICQDCSLGILPEIYKYGFSGIVQLIFKDLLSSNYNRKKRRSLSSDRALLKSLLYKYKFKCVVCEGTDNLTIDHKYPVALGGCDNYNNLQILCKSCNSKKGKKLNFPVITNG